MIDSYLFTIVYKISGSNWLTIRPVFRLFNSVDIVRSSYSLDGSSSDSLVTDSSLGFRSNRDGTSRFCRQRKTKNNINTIIPNINSRKSKGYFKRDDDWLVGEELFKAIIDNDDLPVRDLRVVAVFTGNLVLLIVGDTILLVCIDRMIADVLLPIDVFRVLLFVDMISVGLSLVAENTVVSISVKVVIGTITLVVDNNVVRVLLNEVVSDVLSSNVVGSDVKISVVY